MKTLLNLITVFLISNYFSFGQTEFKYNENGLVPKYLVVEIEKKSSKDLFNKSINWIKETYKNPDEVISTTIENEKIRFEGYVSDLFCVNSLGLETCYNGNYTIEISFRDGRYKFEPLSLKYRIPQNGSEQFIDFDDGSGYYKNNGKIRKMWNTIPKSIENLFNDLNSRLKEYVNKKETQDDW